MNNQLLQEERILTHEIKIEVSEWLAESVQTLSGRIPGMQLEQQFAQAKSVFNELIYKDKNLARIYERTSKARIDALFLSGLPLFTGKSKTMNNRVLSMVLGSHLGEVFQYKQQHEGTLIPSLVPKLSSVSNTNATTDDFGAHSDDAFVPHDFRVQYISLLGERNDSNTATGYAPITDAIRQLKPRQVEVLMRPWFRFKLPKSFNPSGIDSVMSPRQPIIFQLPCGATGVQCPTYATKISQNVNQRDATEALDAFKKAIKDVMQWKVIGPSTCLIISNNRGLHARAKIDGSPDGRKIYRAYWHNNLTRMRKATGDDGNVFDLPHLISHFNKTQKVH